MSSNVMAFSYSDTIELFLSMSAKEEVAELVFAFDGLLSQDGP